MAVRRADLRVRTSRRLSTSALTISRERAGAKRQSVVNDDDQELARRRRERLREIAAGRLRRIEIVERLGDPQVGVRVVILGELFALVAQIRFDLELGRERELEAVAQRAAEFLLHLLVGQIRDVADHPRDAQPAPRLGAVRVEMAVVEIGIGEYRLPRDLVERDVLRRQVRRGGDHERVADAFRVADRPIERLHAAEASAHHRRPLPNAEMVGKPRLRVDPVLDGDQRKVGAPRLARSPDSIVSGPVEPKQLPRLLTPTTKKRSVSSGLPGPTMLSHQPTLSGSSFVEAGDVMRRVERVADEHRIGARRR